MRSKRTDFTSTGNEPGINKHKYRKKPNSHSSFWVLTNLSLGYLVGGQDEIDRRIVVARHVQDGGGRRGRVDSKEEAFLAGGGFHDAHVGSLATLR